MHKDEREIHVSEEEASGGRKEGVVRWVLVIGTLLAIALLSVIWITGAATQGDVEEEATASGTISSQDSTGAQTDSIIGVDDTDIGSDEDATTQDDARMEDGLEVIENDAN